MRAEERRAFGRAAKRGGAIIKSILKKSMPGALEETEPQVSAKKIPIFAGTCGSFYIKLYGIGSTPGGGGGGGTGFREGLVGEVVATGTTSDGGA